VKIFSQTGQSAKSKFSKTWGKVAIHAIKTRDFWDAGGVRQNKQVARKTHVSP
jgi:hypothetical protein